MYKYLDSKGEHMHTLHDKPLLGTSTIVGIIAKPLTWWASGMACKEMGWTNAKDTSKEVRYETAMKAFHEIQDGTIEDFMSRLDRAYSAHSKNLKKTAGAGTDLHAELEAYVKHCIERGGTPILASDTFPLEAVQIFSTWACENVEKFLWSEGNCYSEVLWVGGISDCGALLKDGKTAIIDFKSSKEAYMTHFVQIAGYALQIEENGLYTPDGIALIPHAPATKIEAMVVFPFGGGKPTTIYAVDSYKEAFKSAVNLYKLNATY
jgi:hypothetical protein